MKAKRQALTGTLLWAVGLTVGVILLMRAPALVPREDYESLVRAAHAATDMPLLDLGYDFHYLWAAGHGAGQGRSIYDPMLLLPELWQSGWLRNWSFSPFPYHPWTLSYFIPLGFLSFSLAKFIWLMIVLAGLFLGAFWSRAYFGSAGKLELSLPRLLMLSCLFAPSLALFFLGQGDSIAMCALVLGSRWSEKRRDFAAGAAFAVGMYKFHILIPFFAALFLYLAKQGRYRTLLAVYITLTAQLVFVLSFYPSALADYWSFWSQTRLDFYSVNLTLSSLLADALGIPGLKPLLVVAASLGCIYCVSARNFNLRQLLVYTIPVSLLAAPYAFLHSLIVALPAVIVLGAVWCGTQPAAAWLLILIQLLTYLLLAGEAVAAQPLALMLPPILTLLLILSRARLVDLLRNPD